MQSFLFVDKSNNLEYVWTLSCREDRDFCIVTTLLLHCDVSVLSPSVLRGQWKRCKRQLEILHPLCMDWNKGSFIHYCTCRVGENLDITQNVCWFGFFFYISNSMKKFHKGKKTPQISPSQQQLIHDGWIFIRQSIFMFCSLSRIILHETFTTWGCWRYLLLLPSTLSCFSIR